MKFLATGCRSTTASANDFVPCGTYSHDNGGDTFSPFLPYFEGIVCLSSKADDLSTIISNISILKNLSACHPARLLASEALACFIKFCSKCVKRICYKT